VFELKKDHFLPTGCLGFGCGELYVYIRFQIVHSSIECIHLNGDCPQLRRQEILDDLPDILNHTHAMILAEELWPVN